MSAFTDVETLVQRWLKASALAAVYLTRPDGGISIYKAMPKASPLPSIVLTRVGGAPAPHSDVGEDVARISFDCWAASREVAVDLAMILAGELEMLAPMGGYVDGLSRLAVAEVVSWIWLPDPASDTSRYVVDALVTAITG